MLVTMSDYLETVEPFLEPALVSLPALKHIRSIAEQLPPASVSALECRVSDRDPQADLALVVLRNEGLVRKVLQEREPGPGAWRLIRRFFQEWTAPDSVLGRTVHNGWLEFDLIPGVAETAAPSLFYFGLREADGWDLAVADGLERLGCELQPAVERRLRHCFEALPPRAHVFQVGVALGRRTEAIRLCVQGLACEQVPAYLADAGWHAGRMEPLIRLLSELSGLVPRIALHLDIAELVLPKVGIECWPEEKPPFSALAVWRRFLLHLVEAGLCVPEKSAALLAWPGHAEREVVWPGVFIRALSHAKIVWQPDRALEAKVYLGLAHRWRSELTA